MKLFVQLTQINDFIAIKQWNAENWDWIPFVNPNNSIIYTIHYAAAFLLKSSI